MCASRKHEQKASISRSSDKEPSAVQHVDEVLSVTSVPDVEKQQLGYQIKSGPRRQLQEGWKQRDPAVHDERGDGYSGGTWPGVETREARVNKTTTPRKARSHESHSAKNACRLWRLTALSAALCSAALAQSGTDVMVPLIP